MIYRVSHLTEYHYSAPVTLAHHLVHLCPRETAWQIPRHHSLKILPDPALAHERIDAFGNHIDVFIVQEGHMNLLVDANSDVEVLPRPKPIPEQSPSWESVRDGLSSDLSNEGLDVFQYVFDSQLVRCSHQLFEYARASFSPGRPVLEAALDLTKRIHADFVFDPTATTVSTPLTTVMELKRGVCQDFAHLEVGCLRSLGLAARYVSGYIETAPAPGQEKWHGADASHAWASIYCPGSGWIDLDPTNNLLVSDQHITVAWGRDFSDVSPQRGVILGGGQHTLTVGVSVVPLLAKEKESANGSNGRVPVQQQQQQQTQQSSNQQQ